MPMIKKSLMINKLDGYENIKFAKEKFKSVVLIWF